MEQSEFNEIPSFKIYRDRAIWAGTFLGGPLVAGYLIAENFKLFNEYQKARITWFITIAVTIAVFGTIFIIPENIKLPNQIFPLIYTGVAYYCVQHYQGTKINEHIESGGEFFRGWRIFWIGLIGLIITAGTLISIGLFSDTVTNINSEVSKKYGIMNHEITFDKNNIAENEIDKIAEGFVKTTFFDQAITKYVYVKKIETNYEISVSCNKSIESDPAMLDIFTKLKNDMQTFFPNNKITFNLVVGNLDNVVKRIE
jgi:hypothetical protein